MASIVLHQTRSLLPAFRLPLRPMFAAALPTFLASQKPFNWTIPSLQSLLELLPPFLLAVPKKKVSHSRKAMRSANKGLKDKKSTCIVIRSIFFFPSLDACVLVKILSAVQLAVNRSLRIIFALAATLHCHEGGNRGGVLLV